MARGEAKLLEENVRLKTEDEFLALQLAAESKGEDAEDLKAKLESLAAVHKDYKTEMDKTLSLLRRR